MGDKFNSLPALVSGVEIPQSTVAKGYSLSVMLPKKSLTTREQVKFNKVIDRNVYSVHVGDTFRPTRYKCLTMDNVQAIIDVIQDCYSLTLNIVYHDT